MASVSARVDVPDTTAYVFGRASRRGLGSMGRSDAPSLEGKTMNKNVLQSVRAMLLVAAAMFGYGCMASNADQPENATPGSENAVGSAEERVSLAEPLSVSSVPSCPYGDDVCTNAEADTTACGGHIGFGGNRNWLFTCEGGKLLGCEKCPGTCQHRPWGLSDICV